MPIDQEAMRMITYAGYLADKNNTNIRDELRDILSDPFVIGSADANSLSTSFANAMVYRYGSVTVREIAMELGRGTYLSLLPMYMRRMFPNKCVVHRDTIVDKMITGISKPTGTVVLIGPRGSGKNSVLNSFAATVNEMRNWKYYNHDIVIVDEQLFALYVNYAAKANENILGFLGAFEVRKPILVFRRGDIISSCLMRGAVNNTYNQPVGVALSIMLDIDTPKIIFCDPINEAAIRDILSGNTTYIDVTVFEDDELPKKREIVSRMIDGFNDISGSSNTTYIIGEDEFEKDDFIGKLINDEVCISDISSSIDDAIGKRESAQSQSIVVGKHLSNSIEEAIRTLGDYLHEHIVGQGDKIDALCGAIKRNLIYKSERPLCSGILAGPTGVGKTETAKRLAEHMYGLSSLLQLNMAEYDENHSLSSLLGSPPGYVGYGETSKLDEFLVLHGNNGGVILFDELEKAAENVQRVLLGMLDDGTITMRDGRTHNLSNYVIICTTNASTEKMEVGFSKGGMISDDKLLYGSFSKELVGRFDVIAVYDPLDNESLLAIAEQKLELINEKVNKSCNLIISWNREALLRIVDTAFEKNGRAVEFVVMNTVLSLISDYVDKHHGVKALSIGIVTDDSGQESFHIEEAKKTNL